jgi:hypothetical protein
MLPSLLNVSKIYYSQTHCESNLWAQATRVQEREKVASLAQLARNVKFFVNGEPLETVTEFKFLGQILSADDSDDGAVNMNITKATKTWFRMHRVLSHDTVDHRVMG